MSFVLLFSVAIIGTCGLIYELIAGALASYLLGDSITQFSIIIGIYLFSMGIGSYLSKYITKNLLSYFIRVELLVGLVGGSSAAILFLLFEHITSFRVLLYFIVVITGTLVGLEIPLLMRLLKDKFEFKELVSKVFTIDYIGALFASLIFPLVLVPHVGLIRSAFLFGILNVSVGIWGLYAFKEEIAWKKTLKTSAFSILFILLMGFVYSNKLLKIAETASYNNQIIFSKSSKYQRIIITKGHEDLRLYLNGNLQFSSKDEYRYHESLVHPGMESLKNHKNILVLGGGDGLEVIRGDAYYQSYIFRIPRSSTCAGARPSPVALKYPSKPVNFQSAWVQISAAPLASIFWSRALITARSLPLAWALGSTPIVSRTAILPWLPNSPS